MTIASVRNDGNPYAGTDVRTAVNLLISAVNAAQGSVVQKVATGGAAGNITVTGIATTSTLVSIIFYAGAGTAVTDVTDLTSEFTITAANTINNTLGTNTTGGKLVVTYSN